MSMFAQLEKLAGVIAQRAQNADPQSSYVAKLLARGHLRAAKKVAEEGAEVAMASAREQSSEIIYESADLLFHLLLLWQAHGVTPQQVMDELVRREGVSGIAEKKGRKHAGQQSA